MGKRGLGDDSGIRSDDDRGRTYEERKSTDVLASSEGMTEV